jgi:WD40 repeat protein
MPENIQSYHLLVLVHEAVNRRICYPLEYDLPLKAPTHYLLAWPVHESSAYMVALSGHYLIWVDIESMKKMYIKDLKCQNWGTDDLILGDYTLRGHTSRIGLILANNDGVLVSFDVSCDIYVWDVEEKKLERKINTRQELGMIMSMNLYNNFVVCAGINGKIAVWDTSTGRLAHLFSIPDKYLAVLEEHQLNISIYGDLVAFGLSDGKFYIYSLDEQKIIMEFDVMKQTSDRMRRRNQNLDVI